jgi:hypothetical protein
VLNDRPLPTDLIAGSASRLEIREGTLTLRPDGTFARIELERGYRADGAVSGPDTPRPSVGRFAVRGGAITFSQDFGPGLGWVTTGTATLTGARLVSRENFGTFAYEKR